MIIVDKALQQRARDGNPVRFAMVGAGFMARGVALQVFSAVPGMELVAIANRNVDKARQAYVEAGAKSIVEVASVDQLNTAISRGVYAVTDNPMLLCDAEGIDAILEVTGAVEFGARVVLRAIERGKHVLMMNAELDGTVGPLLKARADKAGVVIGNVDGDQPGVIMNLYRFVKGIGVRPVLCGNIKGLHDPYRNPTTQEAFAKRWGQKSTMVTSFADGTKISFEQAIVANATGMGIGKRGMFGPTVPSGTPIKDAANWYPHEALLQGPGIVDYVVAAEPGPGVFVIGTHDDPAQKHYLNLYKLGEGPLYVFYTPYHLCHFEVPTTIARAVLFHDVAVQALDRPYVDVVATAKIDIKAGQVLDGIGGYHTYGLAENAQTCHRQRLLPMGLAEGCTLTRDVAKDAVLTYDDVILPPGRMCDALRREQDEMFFGRPLI